MESFSVYADGFCQLKLYECRRALKHSEEETNQRPRETQELRVGMGMKKVPYRQRLVYVKKNPKILYG